LSPSGRFVVVEEEAFLLRIELDAEILPDCKAATPRFADIRRAIFENTMDVKGDGENANCDSSTQGQS
jgi:hypothetical protein